MSILRLIVTISAMFGAAHVWERIFGPISDVTYYVLIIISAIVFASLIRLSEEYAIVKKDERRQRESGAYLWVNYDGAKYNLSIPEPTNTPKHVSMRFSSHDTKRGVVVALYREGLKHNEIVKRTGFSRDTVKFHIDEYLKSMEKLPYS